MKKVFEIPPLRALRFQHHDRRDRGQVEQLLRFGLEERADNRLYPRAANRNHAQRRQCKGEGKLLIARPASTWRIFFTGDDGAVEERAAELRTRAARRPSVSR